MPLAPNFSSRWIVSVSALTEVRALVVVDQCPGSTTPGGLSIAMSPLLEALADRMSLSYVHTTKPCLTPDHYSTLQEDVPLPGIHVDSHRLIAEVQQIVNRTGSNVALGIDRLLPMAGLPEVLSTNTAEYWPDLTAAFSRNIVRTISPSSPHAALMSRLLPGVLNEVIPYALTDQEYDDLSRIRSERASRSPASPIKMLFPHRSDIRKGHRFALDMLHGLTEAGVPAELTIPRSTSPLDDEMMSGFARRADQLDIAELIRWIDWVSRDDRFTYLEEADLLISLGDFRETFGLASYEAMLGGVPVIARQRPPCLVGVETRVSDKSLGLFMVSDASPSSAVEAAIAASAFRAKQESPLKRPTVEDQADAYAAALASASGVTAP